MFTKQIASKFKLVLIFLFFVSFVIFMSGCACPMDIQECLPDKIYGFWGGLWHGIISPFTFIISLFKDNVTMYACNNSGSWYDFGFVIGAGILFGGGSKASCKN
ncbi:hypothetical protein ACFLU5_03065 [Bacteroidota bacterium]